MKTRFTLFIVLAIACQAVMAQSLLEKLKAEQEKEDIVDPYTMSTFRGTRLSIGHSIETRKKNTLEIVLMTRYWNEAEQPEVNNNFFVDAFCSRIGFDYGITDRLTFGAGSGNPNGIFDAYFKYRLFRQRDDGKGSPFGVTVLQTGTYRSKFVLNVEQRNSFSDKLAFTTQVLIARKFSKKFSLQISPSFIHRTSSRFAIDDHNHFAVGIGPSYKFNNHLSIVSEYYYVANPLKSIDTYGAFVLGVNWELSDVLLQFKMTNNQIFNEDAFITQTPQNFNFKDGNFFFGFHATYHIQL